MSDHLEQLLENVSDEDSFLIFLDALAKDRADEEAKEEIDPSNLYGPGANGWQHSSIENFLDAAAAWGECSKNGLSHNFDAFPNWEKPTNPWKRCAEIISMGKQYEGMTVNVSMYSACLTGG